MGHQGRPAACWMIMVAFYSRTAGPAYKSAGERIIAEGLRRLGLRFAYEYPWAVQVQGKPRLFYPDFSLPDYGVVIEYAGMHNDPEYERIMQRKRRLYREAAVPVIELGPQDLDEHWPGWLMGRLEEICRERLARLERTASRWRLAVSPQGGPGGYERRGLSGRPWRMP